MQDVLWLPGATVRFYRRHEIISRREGRQLFTKFMVAKQNTYFSIVWEFDNMKVEIYPKFKMEKVHILAHSSGTFATFAYRLPVIVVLDVSYTLPTGCQQAGAEWKRLASSPLCWIYTVYLNTVHCLVLTHFVWSESYLFFQVLCKHEYLDCTKWF